MRARCLKCRMGFRVGPPERKPGPQPEYTRCDCGLRFWHRGHDSIVIVGVLPEDMTDNLVTEDVA